MAPRHPRSVGIRALRENLSRYLHEVAQSGEPLVVTDHGQAIVTLLPVVKEEQTDRLLELQALGMLIPARNPRAPLSWPRKALLAPGEGLAELDEARGD